MNGTDKGTVLSSGMCQTAMRSHEMSTADFACGGIIIFPMVRAFLMVFEFLEGGIIRPAYQTRIVEPGVTCRFLMIRQGGGCVETAVTC